VASGCAASEAVAASNTRFFTTWGTSMRKVRIATFSTTAVVDSFDVEAAP
jgi:hypothetical protein